MFDLCITIFFLFHQLPSSQHLRLTMEAESDHKQPFLDICIDNTGPTIVTRVFCKKTFTGLLTCYSSFTSFSYKRQAFNGGVSSLTFILKKNLYPSRLIERIINRSVNQHVTGNSVSKINWWASAQYLPSQFTLHRLFFYIIAQERIRRLSPFYCNNVNIGLAFSSFKVSSLFSVKEPISQWTPIMCDL